MTDLLFWSLTCVLMLVGLAGTILPLLPGQIIVMAAAVLHYFTVGAEQSPGWTGYIIMGVLLALSYLLEYAGSALGTKKFGGTKAGMAGALIGGLVGIFFGFVGIIIGPILGALFAELVIAGREWRESGKAATGAFIGFLLGMVGKFGCTVAMIGVFFVGAINK
ncbi:MAG: DUF456 domain-containing protein [Verrucomicrobiales bacterium]